MQKTEFIRVFPKGNLIAFRGHNLKARWYRYTQKRFASIIRLTGNWSYANNSGIVTLRKP